MAPADPKDVVRRGYDTISYAYRADDPAPDDDLGHYAGWIARLREYLPKTGSVLDLGCGCGVPVSRLLVDGGYAVTGVDFSAVQVERARRLVPAATFLRADATTVAFPEASFDAVVCLFAIIHIPLAEQRPMLERVASWLRPGGCLLLTAGNDAWTGVDEDWCGAPMWWSHAGVATYREWLEGVGLHIVAEDHFREGDGGHSVFWAVRPGVALPSPAVDSRAD